MNESFKKKILYIIKNNIYIKFIKIILFLYICYLLLCSKLLFNKNNYNHKIKFFIISICETGYPFCFKNNKGELEGFDVDLICELMKRIRKKFIFLETSHENLIKNIMQNKSILAIGKILPEDSLKNLVIFSRSYFRKKNRLVDKKENNHFVICANREFDDIIECIDYSLNKLDFDGTIAHLKSKWNIL